MEARVAVIGGGFYGCQISMDLLRKGIETKLFEKSSRLLDGASKNNQLRLHQGMHYPRSHETRKQSIEGFGFFTSTYPSFSREIKQNLYGVVSEKSLMDSKSIQACLLADNIPFRELRDSPLVDEITNLESVLQSEERLFLPSVARQYFYSELECFIELGFDMTTERLTKTVAEFDVVIDASYSSLRKDKDVIHESTLLLMLESKGDLPFEALTLIDGPFWSIYPTEEKGVFSLSHVSLGILGQAEDLRSLSLLRQAIAAEHVDFAAIQMIDSVRQDFPGFDSFFSYSGDFFIERKIKRKAASDSRSSGFTKVSQGYFEVRSGKIDAALELSKQLTEKVCDEL